MRSSVMSGLAVLRSAFHRHSRASTRFERWRGWTSSLALALILLLAHPALGQTTDGAWFASIDAADAQLNEPEAGRLLELEREARGKSAEWLWRLARHEFNQGLVLAESSPGYLKHLNRALELSTQAIKADARCAGGHAWYAFTLGKLVVDRGPEEQIRKAPLIRDHLERAITLNPTDSDSYLALGRWHYELADLSWLERKLAATLFAKPPEGSFERAEHYLKLARQIDPRSIESTLWLGKTKLKLDKRNEARGLFQETAKLPLREKREQEMQKEADKLLRGL